jgi:uncharacterized membrane protein
MRPRLPALRGRSFLRDRRGAASIIVASAGAMLLGFAAVAVDLGFVFLQSRQLQGMADLAAMAAARDLPNARAAAEATARANGWNGALTVTVIKGVYTPNAAVAAGQRFVATEASPNAVRVTLGGQADLFFGRAIVGRESVAINRTGTAARAELAAFSLGSRLASLNGGVANSLLSGLTGSSVSLSVMDYQALVGADVQLFEYIDALRTNLHLEGMSYDKVLATNVSTGKALTVLGTLLDSKGQDRAGAAVRAIAVAAGNATPAKLDKLLSLGPYGKQDQVMGGHGAGVAVSAMDLTNATLQLASGGRQVKLDLGATVPGLADIDVWLAIGERPNNSPWLAIDRDGSVILRTAQARVYLEAKVGTGGLIGSLTQLKVPIVVEAASAEAKISALNCAAGAATLAVRPSIGDVWIGEVDTTKLNDFKTPLAVGTAQLAKLPILLTITASAHAKLGGTDWQQVNFSSGDIAAGTVKTVSTGDLARTLVASLVGDTSIGVDLLGLGILLGKSAVTATVGNLLGAVAAPLDGVLNSVMTVAGVRLGEADVRVSGLRCKDAVLVA